MDHSLKQSKSAHRQQSITWRGHPVAFSGAAASALWESSNIDIRHWHYSLFI